MATTKLSTTIAGIVAGATGATGPTGATGATGASGATTTISNGTSNLNIATSGGSIFANTAGTNAVTINTSQNVGIGTASPAQKLDVNGNLQLGQAIFTGTGVTTGSALIELGSIRTGDGVSYIDFHSTPSTDYESRIIRQAGANGGLQIVNTGTGDFQLQGTGAAPITFQTQSIERMRIESGGFVEIGTTETLGNSYLNVNQGVVARTAAASGVTPFFQMYNGNAGTDLKIWRMGVQSNGRLGFETVNDAYSSSTERMVIDSSGNLVVGASSNPSGLYKIVASGTDNNNLIGSYNTATGNAGIRIQANAAGLYLQGSGTVDPLYITNTSATGYISFRPSSDTEKARINQYGLGLGGTAPSSGTGIAFPATQSASSDANTLDDYEEGTFTPTITAASGSMTYGSQQGHYTKIGRTVICTFWVQWTGTTLSGSPVIMNNLPFNNAYNSRPSPSIRPSGFASATNVIGGWLPGGTTYIQIQKYSAGNTSDVAGSDIPGGGEYGGTIVYQTT